MLRLEGLAIRAAERPIVRDVSLALSADEIVCLIGASGCGKTSVVKWLAGVLPAGLRASGRATLDGRAMRPPQRGVAYQPQQDALFPWLTIAENAALGLRVAGLSRAAARGRVTPHFPAFGLAGCEDSFPHQLSGGMRQRAAFLRAAVQDARFLLLDEPFSALDAVTRLAMQDWLCGRLAERPRGVLFVTHDLYEATRLADRILVMAARPGRPGQIVAEFPISTPRDARDEAALAPLRARLKSLLMEDCP